MGEVSDLAELETLYASLSPDERNELLQCLLTAAAIGGGSLTQRLKGRLPELTAKDSCLADLACGRV